MPISLNFDLIKSLIEAGADTNPGKTVDPSLYPVLQEAGVPLVATYVEQLSLLGLMRDAKPLLGVNGGMWIGFSLTENGRELAGDDVALRRVVAPLIGGPRTEVSEAVVEVLSECQEAEINEIYAEDFLKSLDEVRICFDSECYIAAIGLCGKLLEVCLKEVLLRHNVKFDPNSMVGTLVKMIRQKVPGEYLHPSVMNVVNIINTSRITAVHAKERIPVPSRDQAIMVIFATRDIVRRNLSHRQSG